MTLENLAAIGKLKAHKPAPEEYSGSWSPRLPKTIGLAPDKMRLYDAFRRARNVADYEGDPVEEKVVKECIEAAQTLLDDMRTWLEVNRPDLLKKTSK